MAHSGSQMISVQGFLLLWAMLCCSPWNLCALADSVPISGTALFSNSSAYSTGMMPLTCQSFRCSGERCYQAEAHGNSTEPCRNSTHCELYRLNSTSYAARCSSACGGANGTEMCVTNSSTAMSLCVLECCSSTNCLRLNATAYGDLPPPTTTPAPTTASTTKAPPKNGKVCSSFTCHGEGCYKGQKASSGCTVGYNFCEMKKTGPHFVAGCSKACRTDGVACAKASRAPCYQECCPATPKVSCLKLDGRVHFNRAGRAGLGALLQLAACTAVLALNYVLLRPSGAP